MPRAYVFLVFLRARERARRYRLAAISIDTRDSAAIEIDMASVKFDRRDEGYIYRGERVKEGIRVGG